MILNDYCNTNLSDYDRSVIIHDPVEFGPLTKNIAAHVINIAAYSQDSIEDTIHQISLIATQLKCPIHTLYFLCHGMGFYHVYQKINAHIAWNEHPDYAIDYPEKQSNALYVGNFRGGFGISFGGHNSKKWIRKKNINVFYPLKGLVEHAVFFSCIVMGNNSESKGILGNGINSKDILGKTEIINWRRDLLIEDYGRVPEFQIDDDHFYNWCNEKNSRYLNLVRVDDDFNTGEFIAAFEKIVGCKDVIASDNIQQIQSWPSVKDSDGTWYEPVGLYPWKGNVYKTILKPDYHSASTPKDKIFLNDVLKTVIQSPVENPDTTLYNPQTYIGQ